MDNSKARRIRLDWRAFGLLCIIVSIVTVMVNSWSEFSVGRWHRYDSQIDQLREIYNAIDYQKHYLAALAEFFLGVTIFHRESILARGDSGKM